MTHNIEQHVAYFESVRRNGKLITKVEIGFGTVHEAEKFLFERQLLLDQFTVKKDVNKHFCLYNDFSFTISCSEYPTLIGELALDGFGHGMNPDHIYSMREIELIREDYAKAVKENPEEKKLREEMHPRCVLIKEAFEDDFKFEENPKK